MLFLVVVQRHLLYFPTKHYVSLQAADAHPALREVQVHTQDGLTLTNWYAPATSKPYTVVFFHGNGDSLARSCANAYPWIQAGYGFLLTEYRGYSGMPGSPSEQGLYQDGRAAIRNLIAQGVSPDHILLVGHSMGTGVTTQMAREFPVAGVILLAPYRSIPAVAQTKFPIFPVYWMLLDRYMSEEKISSLHMPLLIVNGTADHLIPPSHGKHLFELANAPKEFHSLPEVGHNDVLYSAVPIMMKWADSLQLSKPQP